MRVERNSAFILIMLMLLCLSGCTNKNESENDVPARDINLVMKDHTEELMKIEGVVGVAIGELEDHTPCILVLIVEESEILREKLPTELEGHPVSLLVSGEFKPMGGN